MVRRAAVVVVLLLTAHFYIVRAGSVEALVPREPLSELPFTVGDWQGHDEPALADDVLGQLGVDDYVNRQYLRQGSVPVGLYVGYYASQRHGDTIHSPQNCLPGAGWRPVETTIADLQDGDRTVRVNQFVIQKGLDKQLVFYWYQGRGRVIANEYRNKALLMMDAARIHRTNGGLVRMITPVVSTTDDAKSALSALAVLLLPHLDRHLP
jgi:EpsI family protein